MMTRFQNTLSHWANKGVPQMLGVVLFISGAGLGISLVAEADKFRQAVSYYAAFHFASPVAWGMGMIILSLLLVVSVFTDPKLGQLPALLYGALFIIFGLLVLFQSHAGGLPTMFWAGSGLGWVAIVTEIICGSKERYDPPTRYHKS